MTALGTSKTNGDVRWYVVTWLYGYYKFSVCAPWILSWNVLFGKVIVMIVIFLFYRDLSVAKPFHIETPRSLVEVVTNWNLPWHYWLKTCMFTFTQVYITIVLLYQPI